MRELLVKTIILTALMLGLTLLQNKINVKRKDRCTQLIRVFIALGFGLLAMFACLRLAFLLRNLIDQLTDMANLDISANNLVSMFSAVVFFNVLIYVCYVVFRMVPGLLARILLRNKVLFEDLVSKFYEYDVDLGKWFLQEKRVNMRSFFRWLTQVGAVICAITLVFLWEMKKRSGVEVYIFPAVLQLVIAEFYGFLNGLTKDEFYHTVGGDDSIAQHISNFYRIREIYERTFPKEVLASATSCEYASMKGTIDLLEKLKEGEREDAIVAQFFGLNETEENYDADCIEGPLHLMKKENVVFFNPFYHDIGKYLVLPMMNTLFTGKKCLIIVGRYSVKEDIKNWASDLLWEYSKIRSLWRVNDLSRKEPDCEVGVLTSAQLYDETVLEVNHSFLSDVGFVFLLEPSRMITTGQVALSILAEQMEKFDEKPVYCIADRITDGLVDTMSHLLQSEITKVIAPPVSRNIHTGMAWNADGDYLRQELFGKQTRYLGNGLELAAVAVKNQVPEVLWFGESKVPVRDIRWISGQYYPEICQYMNLPIQQQSLYEKIKFISAMWSEPEGKEQFIIAEDEFTNMFSTMRTFLSRGTEQTFVNVLSENYLLRDYMKYNAQLFRSNPNAVPSIVPEYAKTERNTLLKLLIRMTFGEISESEIRRELMLIGIESQDVNHVMTKLLTKYTNADSSLFSIHVHRIDSDGITLDEENVYSVNMDRFEYFFGNDLRNAFYICEEEEEESEYIDAKLFGHVVQTVLPGQFLTYDGKYYMAQRVSPTSGVILRRASQQFNGRRYYRQIRNYVFTENLEKEIISRRTVMDLEITRLRTDFEVNTLGYLDLPELQNLRKARVVDLSEDPSVERYKRSYKNKEILRIKLPETTDRVRFTIAVLLSEIFRSVFCDSWPYLGVLCPKDQEAEGMLDYLTYRAEGKIEEGYIYIVEDSILDLGLLEAVEKNFLFFFELVTDFLAWHYEQMQVQPPKKAEATKHVEFPSEPPTKPKSAIRRLLERIGIGKKKQKPKAGKKPEAPVNSTVEEKVENVAEAENATQAESASQAETEAMEPTPMKAEEKVAHPIDALSEELFTPEDTEDPEMVAVDGIDIADRDSLPEDEDYLEEEFEKLGVKPILRTPYAEETYLKFGFDEIDHRLELDQAKAYLTLRGFSNNSLTLGRHREAKEPTFLDNSTLNHCDFCGIPLNGVSYEKLTDGRIRCNDCTATAIKNVDDFAKIFFQSIEMMQNFYGIEYKSPITVGTMDAKKIAKGAGSVYTPTTEVAERVLGYAQKKGDAFIINIENGSPRLATIMTMTHELTHIWQYLNWNDHEIRRLYPKSWQRDMVYEGMAMWASIQYLYLIGESSYAKQQEMLTLQRQDVYGIGFAMYCEKYPLIKDASLILYSPFTVFPPL